MTLTESYWNAMLELRRKRRHERRLRFVRLLNGKPGETLYLTNSLRVIEVTDDLYREAQSCVI